MEIEGKILECKMSEKPWQNARGVKQYNHYLKVDAYEDGKTQIQLSSTKQMPPYFNVGETIKIGDITKTEYGVRGKRITDYKGGFGGGKAKVRSFDETKRMCKGSALKAAATINKTFSDLVVSEDDMTAMCNFVIGGIRGDIPKWDSSEGEEMIWRQSCLHSSTEEIEARGLDREEVVSKLIEIAQKKYEYIYR